MEVQQALHQEEAARETGDEELLERGSPVEVQQTLHQKETGRKAGAEDFPERGTLWSLKTDAGGEMRRPIIMVVVEDGNGKEDRESCGNGDKRPAGIAAPREEWKDFVGAVEDKGDEESNQDRAPSHPLSSTHSSPSQGVSGGQPRRKHTLASGTRSEATDWARGGCGDHCELSSSSLGGQTAELVTSAG